MVVVGGVWQLVLPTEHSSVGGLAGAEQGHSSGQLPEDKYQLSPSDVFQTQRSPQVGPLVVVDVVVVQHEQLLGGGAEPPNNVQGADL